MECDWDQDKDAINRAKHRIGFTEAQTVFDDPLFLAYPDPDHSNEENRYVILGSSLTGRLLVVSYTERQQIIRLISSRKATRAERQAYEEDL